MPSDFRLALICSIADPTPQGQGFCYWAPEWVAFKGSQATDGSSWENMTLFDFNFKATEAIKAFRE
jgi:arabinogalactan endo-1,4-beta-galactosidase